MLGRQNALLSGHALFQESIFFTTLITLNVIEILSVNYGDVYILAASCRQRSSSIFSGGRKDQ